MGTRKLRVYFQPSYAIAPVPTSKLLTILTQGLH